MCNFLSALVTRTGEVLTLPEYTDSHEDLVEHFGLTDDGQKFCRVEFTPEAEQPEVVDGYKFTIDERQAPSWFDDEMKEKVIAELKRRVTAMLVLDERRILLSGCYIVYEGAKVEKIKNSRIIAICGSAQVKYICGSAQVKSIYGSAQVESICDSAKVEYICGSAQVESICDSAKVEYICDSAKVKSIYGSAQVESIYGSAKVESICGSAKVESIYGSAKVESIYGSAKVESICGSARILNDKRERKSARILNDKRERK